MSSFPTEKYPERSPQTDVGSFCWIALQYYDVKSTTQASPVKEEGRTDRKGATFLDNHGNPPILTIKHNNNFGLGCLGTSADLGLCSRRRRLLSFDLTRSFWVDFLPDRSSPFVKKLGEEKLPSLAHLSLFRIARRSSCRG